jgi:hypothetical protein
VREELSGADVQESVLHVDEFDGRPLGHIQGDELDDLAGQPAASHLRAVVVQKQMLHALPN